MMTPRHMTHCNVSPDTSILFTSILFTGRNSGTDAVVAEELVLDAQFNCGLPGSLVDISVLHPALHQSLSGSQDE